jgi:predicted DNA-binding transcriptional regulator AlpA
MISYEPNDPTPSVAASIIAPPFLRGRWRMTDQEHRRLRTPAAADYLGYAESTLEKKRLTGDGPPFIRLGRVIVYDTRDLDSWLSARRATSARAAS